VRDIGSAGADDAPDDPLLVGVELDDTAGAGKLQMAAVKVTRDEIVEAIIVDAGEAVGPVGVGPDPGLESRLDFRELILRGLGIGGVEDAFFDAVFDENIIDLQ